MLDVPLSDLLLSWQIALQSANRSPRTVVTYTTGINSYLRWCDRTENPKEITKPLAQAWIADLLNGGATAATADTWLGALKRFSSWLEEEGEIPENPLVRMTPPKQEQKLIHALTDEQLKQLIQTCKAKTFVNRRDEAIIRLMTETGIRANELISLRLTDVSLSSGAVIIHRGKGYKGRTAPFGPQTAAALDRYLRVRKQKAAPTNTQLFVGATIKSFSYWALAATLRRRAKVAGIEGFHVHKMRHTAATRWLRAGGSEGGLMAVAGWSNRDMIDRYTRATAAERAAEESRKLNLGDF